MLDRFYVKNSNIKDILSFYSDKKITVLFINRPCSIESNNKNIECISLKNTEIESVLAGRSFTDLIVYGYEELDMRYKSFILSRIRSTKQESLRLYSVRD